MSADTLTLVLRASRLSATSFTGVGLHFCTASGSNCEGNTGFAAGAAAGTAVIPDGTMMLMSSGRVGLAAFVRRRIR